MQQAICGSETIYQIYLDLRKAYDSIDRNRVLRIMEVYKVGPNIRRYIRKIWEKQHFMLRQAGFYSDTINVERGVTQGDIDSPIIFNIIIDAVLQNVMGSELYNKSITSSYADDGLIEHKNPEALQKDLDIFISLFEKMGLKTNASKTKYV